MDCSESPLDVLTRAAATLVESEESAVSAEGDDRTKTPAMSMSPVAQNCSSPPPGKPDSLLLLSASARRHKLKRHREQRDLDDYASAAVYYSGRAKKYSIPSEELNSIGGSITDSREEDDEDGDENTGTNSGSEMDVADSDHRQQRRRDRRLLHQGRLLLLCAEPAATETAEEDAPLDMTTTKRRRSPDDTAARLSPSCSSPSPSPPPGHSLPSGRRSPSGHPPPFPAPPGSLLYGHYPGTAPPPPPPYYPLGSGHYHPHHVRAGPPGHGLPPAHHRGMGRSPSPPSCSPPPPPPYVPQQHRPSVITCAPAAAKSAPSSSGAPLPAHRASSRVPVSGIGRSVAPVVPTNGVTRLNLGSATSGGHCNGAAGTARRSLSDPTPISFAVAAPPASSAGAGPHHGKNRRGSDAKQGHRREILSVGMCDPVIDEHFRRSLGKDYPEYLSTAEKPSESKSSTPTSISITGMSVDDHFAKALGDTWLRLQGKIATPAVNGTAATKTEAATTSPPPTTLSGSCSPAQGVSSNSNGSVAPQVKLPPSSPDRSESRSASPRLPSSAVLPATSGVVPS